MSEAARHTGSQPSVDNHGQPTPPVPASGNTTTAAPQTTGFQLASAEDANEDVEMRNRSTASFRDIEMPSRSSFSSDNVETRRRLTALFRFSDSHGVSEHANGDGGRDPADGSACPPFTETEIDNIIKSINMAHAHHADAAAGSVAFKSTLRTLGQKLAAIDLYMRRQNDRLDGQIRANRRLVVTNEQLSTTIDTLSKDIQSKDLTIERLNRFMDD